MERRISDDSRLRRIFRPLGRLTQPFSADNLAFEPLNDSTWPRAISLEASAGPGADRTLAAIQAIEISDLTGRPLNEAAQQLLREVGISAPEQK